MIRKLLPLLLALLGLGIGLGAGMALRPTAAPPAETSADGETPAGGEAGQSAKAAQSGEEAPEYVKMTNQFVVPLIEGGKVSSMVILSLSIEVKSGQTADVYTKEPKLRDGFLQVMFDHANAGGFDGPFTDSANMIALRKALLEAAQQTLGSSALDVLITDIVRQDTRS
jgi:flagellar protein FliL